jgi:hypothetical protein
VRKLFNFFLYPFAFLLAVFVLALLPMGPWLIHEWLVQHTLVSRILFWSIVVFVASILFLVIIGLISKWLSGEDRLNKIICLLIWLAATFVAFCFVGTSGILFRKIIRWLIWRTPLWCENLFNALDTIFGWIVLFVGVLVTIVLGQTWTAWYNRWCNAKKEPTIEYRKSHKAQIEPENRER